MMEKKNIYVYWKAVYTEGAGLVCKCIGQCTLEGSVQGGGYRPGGAKFF